MKNFYASFYFTLFVLFSFNAVAQVSYVPASPYPYTLIQKDGSKITLLSKGDELSHYRILEDGFTVVKNSNGIYEYAQKGSNGKLIPSGVKARDQKERKQSEKKFLQGIQKKLAPSPDAGINQLKSATAETLQRDFPSSGARKVLMLLIKYPDMDTTYSVSNFNNLANQPDYNFESSDGSIRDFYLENSYNTLDLSIDVYGWYVADHNSDYYADSNPLSDEHARELVARAIDQANADVDFSIYDNDGDGYVENLMVVHSGYGAEEGDDSYIWSHSWSLATSKYYDGVYISDYIIQPETRDNYGTKGMVGIGVFCHEFGHALGLPDLYDTDDSSEGLGKWCLMSSGSWLNNEKTPACMSAWCKAKLGWIIPTVISSHGNYSLPPLATGSTCYRINTQNSNEYFLLENKYKTGFNSYLPGSGLAIFHVNATRSSNTNENLKMVDLEEADGANDLDNNVNRGDAGDVFPGSTGNTSFNDYSNPNSRTYDSKLTGLNICNIALNGPTINFSLGQAVTPLPNLTFISDSNNITINGTDVSVSLQVKNSGTLSSGSFKIGYYLSSNSEVGTSDYLIGTDEVSGLLVGATASVSIDVDVNTIASLPAGSFYVGYIIDYEGAVAESIEDDNSYISLSQQVQHTSLPNLAIAGGNSQLAIAGDLVSVSLTVMNDGNSAAAASEVGYYLSADNQITIGDYLFDTDFTGILYSGGTSNENTSIDIRAAFPALPSGDYFVGFMVDRNYEVDEEDESDNTYIFPSPKLHFCQADSSVATAEICEGDSLLWEESFYKNSGVYSLTFTNRFGCDSVRTLNLAVNPADNVFLSERICRGDSLEMGGTYYRETGQYSVALINRFGCDSLVTLSLTTGEPSFSSIDRQICDGDSVAVGAEYFKTGGTYTRVLTNSFGCDSTVTLNLVVKPASATTLYRTICQGDSIGIGNTFYKDAGIFTEVLSNRSGCDSTVTLHLAVLPSYRFERYEAICEGDSVSVGPDVFKTSGIYTLNFISSQGCDSVIVLDLTVNPVYDIHLDETICLGDSVAIGDEFFKETGIYTRNMVTHAGCDSTITLNLVVGQPSELVLNTELCEGDSVVVGSRSYFSNGTYFNHLESHLGCDSLVILNLVVHPVGYAEISRIICEGDSVVIGDKAYKTSGTYSNILPNQFGCDSTVVLHLQVNPSYHNFASKSICRGDSILFGSRYYKNEGVYTDYQTTKSGCDSISVLELQVNPVYDTLLSVEICKGETYPLGGINYKEAGTYQKMFTTQAGCDSLVTLHLTVLPVSKTSLFRKICSGDSIVIAGKSFKESGIFSETLVNKYGCDSTITLYLTVNPANETEITRSVCEGESVSVGKFKFNRTGDYSVGLNNRFGCDSTVILHLEILPSDEKMITENICNGDSLLFGGIYFKRSGTYIQNYINRYGCDSVVTLNLSVNPGINKQVYAGICQGQAFLFAGQDYTEAGIYSVTEISHSGCDSTTTLYLDVFSGKDTAIYAEICQGGSYPFGQQAYSEPGIYTQHLQTVNGCDSVATLHLSVRQVSSTSLYLEICEGSFVDFGGDKRYSEGVYTETLTNQFGCDSVITLNLKVNPADEATLYRTVCPGGSVEVGGENFSQPGEYKVSLNNRWGCDSTIVLHLDFYPVEEVHLSGRICAGDSLEFGGVFYKESGSYSHHFISRFGCDSVVTLNLVVNPVVVNSVYGEICEGETYRFAGQDYRSAGVYSATDVSSAGCDSITTLYLEVHPERDTTLEIKICKGESVWLGNSAYSETGAYSEVFATAFGCDSVVTLNLLVLPVADTTVRIEIPQDDSLLIGGIYYKTDGIYYENLISRNGCDSIVTIYLTVKQGQGSGFPEYPGTGLEVAVFPNPASDFITVKIENMPDDGLIQIFSDDGKMVFTRKRKYSGSIVSEKIAVSGFSPGMYTLMVTSGQDKVIKKIVVQ